MHNKYIRWFIGNIGSATLPLIALFALNLGVANPKTLDVLFKNGEVFFSAVSICALALLSREPSQGTWRNGWMAICKFGAAFGIIVGCIFYAQVVSVPAHQLNSNIFLYSV
jgi:hypothetical protein